MLAYLIHIGLGLAYFISIHLCQFIATFNIIIYNVFFFPWMLFDRFSRSENLKLAADLENYLQSFFNWLVNLNDSKMKHW